jgi:hypothetical protein
LQSLQGYYSVSHQQGRIGLEKTKGGIGIEGHTFPTNMVASSFPRGKFSLLTFDRAREAKVVDSEGKYHLLNTRR